MQSTQQKEIKYQFGALPKGSALGIWQANISKDFTPVFFMHICENLNGFSKDGYSYKIDDNAIAEAYQVCTRTVQRARAKLINADIVEVLQIRNRKGVFCYRPSKTSTLKRQICQEKMDNLTDLSRNNQGEIMPKSDSHKQSKKTQAAPLEYEKHKNINTYPKTKTNITKRKTDAKGGDELFKEIKDSLRLSDSNIPTDIEIKELLSEISAKEPDKALVWAIQNCHLGEPIKNLRRFYHNPSTSLSRLISDYVSQESQILGNQKTKQKSREFHAAQRAINEEDRKTHDKTRIKGVTVASPPIKPGLRRLGSVVQTVELTAEQRAEWEARIEAERNNAPS